MSQVIFVGTGEACDPELPNTSLLFLGERNLLCDCGYSVPQALWRVTQDPLLLDAVFVSHAHADHTFGLPALLLWLEECGRQKPLELVGGEGMLEVIRAVLELAYPGLLDGGLGFPVHRVAIPPGGAHALGPLTLRAARTDHLADNHAVRVEAGDGAFAFSGDGGLSDETRALFAGVDLLVHECYRPRPAKPGHADATTLLAAAASLAISQLALVHLGRPHKAAIDEVVRAFRGPPAVRVPRPGDAVTLGR
jgi:ribonuclease BN (tRNA processing enzyme)